MDYAGIAALIGALIAAATTILGGLFAGAKIITRWAREEARSELLAEEAKKALAAKDREIREKDLTIAELKDENKRLWAMVPRQERLP
jgi:hypothetical protein